MTDTDVPTLKLELNQAKHFLVMIFQAVENYLSSPSQESRRLLLRAYADMAACLDLTGQWGDGG
jgi:dimeric dUTPase (all-alpha-NTP-PPase superfamily)